MYNQCIYVCLLPVYKEVFLPIVFGNKTLETNWFSHKCLQRGPGTLLDKL